MIQGFNEAGAELEAPLNRKDIPALLDLLEHEKHWVRANAGRALREISGNRFPLDPLANPYDSPRKQMERNAAIKRWRDWWAREKKK